MTVGRKTSDDEECIQIYMPTLDSNPRIQQRAKLHAQPINKHTNGMLYNQFQQLVNIRWVNI